MLVDLWRDKAKDRLMRGEKAVEMKTETVDIQVNKASSGKDDGRNVRVTGELGDKW